MELDAIALYGKGTKHTLLGPLDDILSSFYDNTHVICTFTVVP
jgi:hypothetical protein